jgi:N-acetylmuramic acid 6-phosphate (MurNAc-6-P) etherase
MHMGKDMLDLETIRAKLADRRLSVISEATGLHRNTIARVKDGTQPNPTYYVLSRLSDYLEARS